MGSLLIDNVQVTGKDVVNDEFAVPSPQLEGIFVNEAPLHGGLRDAKECPLPSRSKA